MPAIVVVIFITAILTLSQNLAASVALSISLPHVTFSDYGTDRAGQDRA